MSGLSTIQGTTRTNSTNTLAASQSNHLSIIMRLARSDFLERVKQIAIKTLAYLGGATLIGGGGALCALPVPVIAQAIGGGMIAGGVMIIGATACQDEGQMERLDRAHNRYEQLSNAHEVSAECVEERLLV